MYNDLEQIAQLQFAKDSESISAKTRERVREMQNEYAALSAASGSLRSGQQEAAIGRTQMEGSESLIRALFSIWVELVKRRRGHIAQQDVAFIANKVDGYASSQTRNLRTAFRHQRTGAVVNLLGQEAELRMNAASASARRDLQIMAKEHEAFPKKDDDGQRNSQHGREEGIVTRHTAEVLNILIASPSDVAEERDVVERVIYDWNASHFDSMGVLLHPIRWESHSYPASGDRPQAIINKQIVESGDILIGIFGYKLGTPTGTAQSGTIEEIEEFRKTEKYVALYFSTANVPRSADPDQLEALQTYKKVRQKDTLYFEFSDAPGLRNHLTRQLPKIVEEVRRKLNLIAASPKLSSESSASTAFNREQDNSPVHMSTLLADLISELEDNLDRASRPRTGDTYRRPSTKVWFENRNKIALPPNIIQNLKSTYNQISSWADEVASGLSPNIGSMQLNLTVSELKQSLPSLVEQLRRLEKPGL
jgi:hypothetical protein